MYTNNPFLELRVRKLALGSLVISFPIGFGLGINNLQPQNPFFTPVAYILLSGLLCLWILQKFNDLGISLKCLVGRLPSNYRWLPNIVLVGFLLLFSSGSTLVLNYLLYRVAPSFMESVYQETPSSTEISASLGYKFLMVLTLVVVAPLLEEFLFRGIIFHRWAAKWGLGSALVGSSFVFGILHGVINTIWAFVFGLVMGLLYIKTRTLVVPILCHALNNAVASLELLLVDGSGAVNTANRLEYLHSDWWVGILLIILSAPWIICFIYKNWPNRNTQVPYFANSLR